MAAFLAVTTHGSNRLPAGLAQRMKQTLAPAGDVIVIEGNSYAVAYCDFNLWPGKSYRHESDCFSVFAGDPVACTADGSALSRPESITLLTQHLLKFDFDQLRSAEGTYCGLVLNTKTGTITACTDKLGVRPAYYAQASGLTFISSTQWALETLPDLPKTPDWRGATETAAFGYALSNRTLFENIKVLGAAESITTTPDGINLRSYWDWAKLPQNNLNGQDLVEFIRHSFNHAVDCRIQGQNRVMAFLSGGMDSRIIVSRLREIGTHVYSLNFAPQGSQDLVFGSMVAEKLGTAHFEFSAGSGSFAERQSNALISWEQAHPNQSLWPENTGVIWSGDGGSVGLGHVYLDQKILDIARRGTFANVAQAICEQNRIAVSPWMFTRDCRQFAEFAQSGIIEDLQSRSHIEPGRNVHLFFMLNDQRRHLVSHFEKLHLSKRDLVLPFFDGRFIAAVLSSSIDPFMLHQLYNDIMVTLPTGAGEIPWQAYPGHVPCPIPAPDQLRRQWQDGWYDPKETNDSNRALCRALFKEFLSPDFPADILGRSVALAACATGAMGYSRYNYLLKAAMPFVDASRKSRTLPQHHNQAAINT